MYASDKSRAIRILHNVHLVAHGNRVSRADSLQAEIPLNLARHISALICAHDVPTASILNYQSFHIAKLVQLAISQ